jgi:predicted enzyme related to lactoylglutathione lyase
MVMLSRVILPVNDVEKAAAFYGALFGLPGERVGPGRYYFQCDKVVVACYDPRSDDGAIDVQPNPDQASFAVEDLEEVYERAKTLPCLELESHITTRPWGERSFTLKDPFGNSVCVVDAATIFQGHDLPPDEEGAE